MLTPFIAYVSIILIYSWYRNKIGSDIFSIFSNGEDERDNNVIIALLQIKLFFLLMLTSQQTSRNKIRRDEEA